MENLLPNGMGHQCRKLAAQPQIRAQHVSESLWAVEGAVRVPCEAIHQL